ncbi:hypothetical protein PGA94_09245 [Pediococcus pentosaceus]|uniref:hypothetical protein n=1 Tax=Pediococcus pentosaceus TaxID=1255 RepID=UPI002330CD5E|nr:hypothetical protein [Pediococcus pentosaceus]MDB1562958.1 hypothetical protein [Pediococcus pentosaceus]
MVDIEKFKSEFKNMKMQSDLMVKHSDVQKLIDKYLTKNNYWVVTSESGKELKIIKGWYEDIKGPYKEFVDAGSGTRFSDPRDAVHCLVDHKLLHLETRYE